MNRIRRQDQAGLYPAALPVSAHSRAGYGRVRLRRGQAKLGGLTVLSQEPEKAELAGFGIDFRPRADYTKILY